MNSLSIIFVRHGETDWNVSGTLQGQRDIELNGTGRVQAARLAARLASSTSVDVIVTSDLARARETAAAVAAALPAGLPPLVCDAVWRERALGEFEGQHRSMLPRGKGEDWVPPGGGESVHHVYRRTSAALQATHRGRQVHVS